MFGCYRIRTTKIPSLIVKALQKLPGIVTSFDKTEGEWKIKYFYRYENLRQKIKMYCFGGCRIKTCSQRVNALPFEKQVRHLDIVKLALVTTAQLHFTRSLNKNAHLNSTYLNYRSATRSTTLRLFFMFYI